MAVIPVADFLEQAAFFQGSKIARDFFHVREHKTARRKRHDEGEETGGAFAVDVPVDLGTSEIPHFICKRSAWVRQFVLG